LQLPLAAADDVHHNRPATGPSNQLQDARADTNWDELVSHLIEAPPASSTSGIEESFRHLLPGVTASFDVR
jgi:hypothetical protein